MGDTFSNSCDHWSEKHISEMEDFYNLANVDYQYLSNAVDWRKTFETIQSKVGSRSIRLLDIACGAGKFPNALLSNANFNNSDIKKVDYSLLDPSGFSINQAKKILRKPFFESLCFESTIQDLKFNKYHFDLVWAVHALYAIPSEELELSLKKFLHVLDGFGFIAHACNDSHYIKFYNYFLQAFDKNNRFAYISAEDILKQLSEIGVKTRVKYLNYTNGTSKRNTNLVESYLQRCVFDDTISMEQMLAHDITGKYLKNCLVNKTNWIFPQKVMLIFIEKF